MSETMQNIKKGERVYMMFKRNKKNQPKNKRYFDHIQSRRIKKKLDLFKKDPNDAKNSQINLGFHTIDLNNNKVNQTTDPANSEEHFEFAEGTTQERERSDPPGSSTILPLSHLSMAIMVNLINLGWIGLRKMAFPP